MTFELERRIAETAPAPTREVDPAQLWQQARRRRHRRLSVASAGAASLVLLAGVVLVAAEPGTPQPVVDQPADAPADEEEAPAAPADEEEGEDTADPAPTEGDEAEESDDETAASGGEPDEAGETDPVPAEDDARPSEQPARVRVRATEATVPPGEPAMAFADIAGDADDAAAVWDRFGLSGEPVEVDFEASMLLVVGFGESGSCPEEFEELDAGGDRVRVRFGLEGVDEDEDVGCTDDANPRTFVLEVERPAIPDGGFVLELDRRGAHPRVFVLAGTPTVQPPAGPTMTWAVTREEPDLSLTAEPATTPGGPVELALANHGDVSAFFSGPGPGLQAGGPSLQRWEGQRWLPAPGQGPHEAHPALTRNGAEVAPGEQARIVAVDPDDLAAGWYRVDASVGLGGSGGRVDLVAAFHVDDPG